MENMIAKFLKYHFIEKAEGSVNEVGLIKALPLGETLCVGLLCFRELFYHLCEAEGRQRWTGKLCFNFHFINRELFKWSWSYTGDVLWWLKNYSLKKVKSEYTLLYVYLSVPAHCPSTSRTPSPCLLTFWKPAPSGASHTAAGALVDASRTLPRGKFSLSLGSPRGHFLLPPYVWARILGRALLHGLVTTGGVYRDSVLTGTHSVQAALGLWLHGTFHLTASAQAYASPSVMTVVTLLTWHLRAQSEMFEAEVAWSVKACARN